MACLSTRGKPRRGCALHARTLTVRNQRKRVARCDVLHPYRAGCAAIVRTTRTHREYRLCHTQIGSIWALPQC
jgi:hypothetical protein